MERLTGGDWLRDLARQGGETFQRFWLGPEDPRVYDLVRIGIALTCLATLIDLWPVRYAMFSESGTMDLGIWRQAISGTMRWSLFLYYASPMAVDVILATGLVASALLALGLFSRAAAIVAWVVIVSYSYRCTFAMNGWDLVIRLFVGILCVSPLGWTLGVDAWRRRRRGRLPPRTVPRYGLMLMRFQVAVIYAQTFWLKVNDEYWRNGEFLSYYMISMYAWFPDPAMADFEVLSALLTYMTLWIELTLPVLLWVRRTRALGFLLGLGLHSGIALASDLGIWIFSLGILATYPCFLEGRDLDLLRRLWSDWRGRARAAAAALPGG